VNTVCEQQEITPFFGLNAWQPKQVDELSDCLISKLTKEAQCTKFNPGRFDSSIANLL
jgi:hypothetical protein